MRKPAEPVSNEALVFTAPRLTIKRITLVSISSIVPLVEKEVKVFCHGVRAFQTDPHLLALTPLQV